MDAKYTEQEAMFRVAAYCSQAERVEYDIRQKLLTWGLKGINISNIIRYLKTENFINEERYCRAFIKDKIRFNKWGKSKIVYELKNKRIPSNIIELCISDINLEEYSEQLEKILIKKLSTIKYSNEYDKRTKLIRFGLGRGFTLDEILRVLSNIEK